MTPLPEGSWRCSRRGRAPRCSEDYGKTFKDITHLINNTFIRTEFGMAIGPDNSGKVSGGGGKAGPQQPHALAAEALGGVPGERPQAWG